MFYVAGVSLRQLGKMASCLIPMVAIGLAIFPYQRQRLTDYMVSVSDPSQTSYQVKQSIIGLAHGGLTGVGYGSGKQKLFFLPEPFSDFILASLGEEFGFVIQGAVTLTLDKEKYRIGKGDCFYFKSDKEHFVENNFNKPAKILWLVSPPVFDLSMV